MWQSWCERKTNKKSVKFFMITKDNKVFWIEFEFEFEFLTSCKNLLKLNNCISCPRSNTESKRDYFPTTHWSLIMTHSFLLTGERSNLHAFHMPSCLPYTTIIFLLLLLLLLSFLLLFWFDWKKGAAFYSSVTEDAIRGCIFRLQHWLYQGDQHFWKVLLFLLLLLFGSVFV